MWGNRDLTDTDRVWMFQSIRQIVIEIIKPAIREYLPTASKEVMAECSYCGHTNGKERCVGCGAELKGH